MTARVFYVAQAVIKRDRTVVLVGLAAVHLFMASDEAAYMTGQVLFVDGGLSVGT